MDLKKWKSGRHEKPGRWPKSKRRSFHGNQWKEADPELYHSMKAAQRFKCKYCREWDRKCPSCAGVY